MRRGQDREAGHTQSRRGAPMGGGRQGAPHLRGGSGILIRFGEQEEGDVCSLNRRQLPGPCCDPALTALHLFRFFAFLEDKGGRGEKPSGVAGAQKPSLLVALLGRHHDHTGTRPVTYEVGGSAARAAPAAGRASTRRGGRGRQRPEHTENGRTPRKRPGHPGSSPGPPVSQAEKQVRGYTGQSSSEGGAHTPICRALTSPLSPLPRRCEFSGNKKPRCPLSPACP